MNKRRKWKTVGGKRKYKQLNNESRRGTDKAREEWWKEKCEEVECGELDRKGR